MESKETSRLAAFIVPWACVLFICVMLVICNAVTLSIESFAVDSQNRIYIGRPEEIHVYEGDRLVKRISAQTSRGYQFTVLKSDAILLSTSSNVYTMDLDGNVLSVREDVGTKTYNKLQYARKNFTSHKGDQYQIRDALGRAKIVKNGTETVYQISVLSVIVKRLIALCIVSIILFIGRKTLMVFRCTNRTSPTCAGFIAKER